MHDLFLMLILAELAYDYAKQDKTAVLKEVCQMFASGAAKLGSRALAGVERMAAECLPAVESNLATSKNPFSEELCEAAVARADIQVAKSLAARRSSSIREPPLEGSDYLYGLEDGLEKLVCNLADGIKMRRWNSFIADDVSGRVPANLIHAVARNHAADNGTRAPQLYYMASGLGGLTKIPKDLGGVNFEHLNGRALSKRVLTNKGKLEEGRVLVITEAISSGGSVARIGDALVKHGIKFDVASSARLDMDLIMGVRFHHHFDKDVHFFCGDAWLYTGGAGSKNLLRLATGVEKYEAEATSRVTRFDQSVVSSLRHETNALGSELYRKVFAESA